LVFQALVFEDFRGLGIQTIGGGIDSCQVSRVDFASLPVAEIIAQRSYKKPRARYFKLRADVRFFRRLFR
jgi:hypothetical protein